MNIFKINKKKVIIIKRIIKVNKHTPICIFSSGIFTKACGSNSTATRK
jgi:hypothetical protein